MPTSWKERIPSLGIAVIVVVAITGIFAPVYLHEYGFSDAYTQLLKLAVAPAGSAERADEIRHVVAMGRPGDAGLMLLLYGWAGDIAGLARIRAFAVLSLAILGLAFYRELRTAAWGRIESGAAAVFLATLPSLQISVAWAATSTHVLAVILSLSAGSLALADRSNRTVSLALLLAIVLQVLATLIYQPAAMMLLFPLACRLGAALEVPAPALRRAGVTLAAGLGMGFLAFRVGGAMYPAVALARGARSGFVHDVPGKLEWFLREPFAHSLQFHALRGPEALPIAAAVVLLLGTLLRPSGGWRPRLVGLAATGAIVGLSYLPNLLTAESWASYRTMIVLAPVLALLTLSAARSLMRWNVVSRGIWTVLLVAAAGWGGVTARRTVLDTIVLPQIRELALAREAIAERLPELSGRVAVRPARWEDGSAPWLLYDEFGITTLGVPWCVRPLTLLILHEQGVPWRPGDVAFAPAGTAPGEGEALLDYHELLSRSPAVAGRR
ncbi:MAG: hypothetical protein R3B81_01815 [bacterium]